MPKEPNRSAERVGVGNVSLIEYVLDGQLCRDFGSTDEPAGPGHEAYQGIPRGCGGIGTIHRRILDCNATVELHALQVACLNLVGPPDPTDVARHELETVVDVPIFTLRKI